MGTTPTYTPDELKAEIDRSVAEFLATLHECLTPGYQGQVSLNVQFFDGRVSRAEVSRAKILKPREGKSL